MGARCARLPTASTAAAALAAAEATTALPPRLPHRHTRACIRLLFSYLSPNLASARCVLSLSICMYVEAFRQQSAHRSQPSDSVRQGRRGTWGCRWPEDCLRRLDFGDGHSGRPQPFAIRTRKLIHQSVARCCRVPVGGSDAFRWNQVPLQLKACRLPVLRGSSRQ